MSVSFSTMLNRLKNYNGSIAYRKSWPKDSYIFVGTMPGNHRSVLMRHEDVYSMPYSIQQDDIFMNDWEVEDG